MLKNYSVYIGYCVRTIHNSIIQTLPLHATTTASATTTATATATAAATATTTTTTTVYLKAVGRGSSGYTSV